MSSLYSGINAYDQIEEGASYYPRTESIASEMSRTNYQPSKRSILREVNRRFKDQMTEMDQCLTEAKSKYNQKRLLENELTYASLPYSISNKNQRIPFSETKSTNLEYFDRNQQLPLDLYDTSSTTNCNYHIAVKQQQNLNLQISAIKQLLAQRVNLLEDLQLQSFPEQRTEIKWDLLMRQERVEDQDDQTYRQLFKTSAQKRRRESKESKEGVSKSYIAYSEESSQFELSSMVKSKTYESKLSKESNVYLQPKNVGVSKLKKVTQCSTQSFKPASISSQNKEKLYEDIQERIAKSSCTAGNIPRSKDADHTNQLFNRLSREKRERENLLKNIKLQIK